MNKIKILGLAVIALMVLNILLLGIIYFGRPGPHPSGNPGERGQPKNIIIKKLKLDEQQQKQYQTLIDQHQSGISSIESEFKKTKNQLFSALNPSLNIPSDSLIQQLGSFQMQLEKLHFNHFTALRNLCREDQVPAFNALSHELAQYFDPLKKGMPPPKE
ncbi:MAG: hypothetical protein ABI761_19780 [Saprospiraceae bacterium]